MRAVVASQCAANEKLKASLSSRGKINHQHNFWNAGEKMNAESRKGK